MTYDLDYFINKFSNIPEEKWCMGTLYMGDGKSCALGHCGVIDYAMNDEANALENILRKAFPAIVEDYSISCLGEFIYSINDNCLELFNEETPRERILSALRMIKKMNKEQGVKECDASKVEQGTKAGNIKTIIKYVSVPETINESLPETILS